MLAACLVSQKQQQSVTPIAQPKPSTPINPTILEPSVVEYYPFEPEAHFNFAYAPSVHNQTSILLGAWTKPLNGFIAFVGYGDDPHYPVTIEVVDRQDEILRLVSIEGAGEYIFTTFRISAESPEKLNAGFFAAIYAADRWLKQPAILTQEIPTAETYGLTTYALLQDEQYETYVATMTALEREPATLCDGCATEQLWLGWKENLQHYGVTKAPFFIP